MIRQIRFGLSFFAITLVIGFAASAVSAQTAAPSKDASVISGDLAKRVLTKGEITAEAAEKIAHVYEEFTKKHGYPGVVYILDPFGNIVHAHRMDGARPVQIDGA